MSEIHHRATTSTPGWSVVPDQVTGRTSEWPSQYAATAIGVLATLAHCGPWLLAGWRAEPEDEGVEVEGCRWRVNGEWVQRRFDVGWRDVMHVDDSRLQGERAIALGLVSAPVPADVQRVLDAAKAWRTLYTAEAATSPGKEGSLCAAVDALGDTEGEDAGPHRRPCWSPSSDETCRGALVGNHCIDCEHDRPTVPDDAAPPPTDGPWRTCRHMGTDGEWWGVATGNDWVDLQRWTAKCFTEADAIKVRDALNATASDWPPTIDAWKACPEHGPACIGPDCCCADYHPALNAAPSWPPMRKMEELPESGTVLSLTDRGGYGVVNASTIRNDDRWLGWWPLPPVPTEEA